MLAGIGWVPWVGLRTVWGYAPIYRIDTCARILGSTVVLMILHTTSRHFKPFTHFIHEKLCFSLVIAVAISDIDLREMTFFKDIRNIFGDG